VQLPQFTCNAAHDLLINLLLQATLELGASAEAIDLFRTITGAAIGDTGMGLCGVASSVLILYEAALGAVRAEAASTSAATS
jgi:hypothetical protein